MRVAIPVLVASCSPQYTQQPLTASEANAECRILFPGDEAGQTACPARAAGLMAQQSATGGAAGPSSLQQSLYNVLTGLFFIIVFFICECVTNIFSYTL